MKAAVQPPTTASEIQLVCPYSAKRISSTEGGNGLGWQKKKSIGLPSCPRHSGYSAEEAKNIGKITKFITPAKFSSCLIPDEISMPSAPSIRPDSTSAGSTVR